MGGKKGVAKITTTLIKRMKAYYAQGYTQKEIATFLGISVASVHNQLKEANNDRRGKA